MNEERSSNSSGELRKTKRSQVRHVRERASYQREDAYQLIDDLKLGHIGFVIEGLPCVIPMTLWRIEDHLYFHCLNKSRLQRHLEAGNEVCISFAESTEWVLAKSAYQHSVNYRSAVLYCAGQRITDVEEFDQAFASIIEELEEGRWEKVRPPNKKERKATALMKLKIDEGSFKQAEGGPDEEAEDMELPVWHGNIPAFPFNQKDNG
ncbi:MAG: hypothetical protein CMQ20_07815 [Gammaproteobacteria bacterium]|nr:hypothetical protein [Gammaproteobacteria bacterium]